MFNIKYSDNKTVFNIHTGGIPFISFDMFDRLGVPNLFTTRYISFDPETGRGVSGLRLAVMNDEDIDEASPVCRKNRDILAHQLGSSISMEGITDQKHTNNVYAISREDLGVATVGNFALHRQYVDGVVTDIPGAVLTVFGGDCPPVYIADPVRGAIGLVHAGWRGTLGKIPEVAVANMVVRYGCRPSDMYAAIGPGICRDCYEMGDEVYDEFADKWGRDDAGRILSRYPAVDADGNEIPGGKYHLDLREANRLTLLRAGIPEDRIAVSNICTKCNADTFYSYRAHRLENEQTAMLVNRFGGKA